MSNIRQAFRDNPNRNLVIATHNGKFHVDELVALYLVDIVRMGDENHRDKPLTIIRTRNKDEYVNADIVIDVGGKHDAIKYFDHHQSRDKYVSGKSSARLVWEDVRFVVVDKLLDLYVPSERKYWENNHPLRKAIMKDIFDSLIKPISDWDVSGPGGVKNVVSLQCIVGSMYGSNGDINVDSLFQDAYGLVSATLHFMLRGMLHEAMTIYITKCSMDDQLGTTDICVLDRRGPWSDIFNTDIRKYASLRLIVQPSKHPDMWDIHMTQSDKTPCKVPIKYRGMTNGSITIDDVEYTVSVKTNGSGSTVTGTMADAIVVARWVLSSKDEVIDCQHHRAVICAPRKAV